MKAKLNYNLNYFAKPMPLIKYLIFKYLIKIPSPKVLIYR